MPLPSESKLPTFRFTAHGAELCIALFDVDAVKWPGIVYPSLLRRTGVGVWVEIDKRDPIWKDIQGDMEPTFMAKLIIDDFNKTIVTMAGVAELTYEQKLAAELANSYKVVNNQLVRI